jgi:hypothetical protein
MQDDTYEGTCAAADLAARLNAEVATAAAELAASEARFQAAIGDPQQPHQQVPFNLRRELGICRRRLAALEQVLTGILTREGGCHAASA